jgi:5-oxoprolinase (ATP-hydrolysing)
MELLLELAADAIEDCFALLGVGETPRVFSDWLDDQAQICISLQRRENRLIVDFTGTSGVHPRGWNATPAIVTAAVLYCLRCLSNRNLPLSEGILRRLELRIPSGLLNPPGDSDPAKCPAVVAGNVETSQRVVDCFFGALGIVAASQGTMNNLLIGDATFGYYETICGGAGATATAPGASAVHTHMTNTRITDPEVLELRYPLRLHTFKIRSGSGGLGRLSGGDGVTREIEMLSPLTISLLTSRRGDHPPYGCQGGEPGASGENWWIHRDGTRESLPAVVHVEMQAGDRVRIDTPGGGGFGHQPRASTYQPGVDFCLTQNEPQSKQ